MENFPYTQKIFKGLMVGIDKVDMPLENTPDCGNVRIDNPLGCLNNEVGIEKYHSDASANAIVAIHQLKEHLLFLTGDKLFRWIPWISLWVDNPTNTYYDATSEFLYITTDSMIIGSIIKSKIDGSMWTEFGTSGSGINQFQYPTDIVYDLASQFLYISDFYNHRIVKTKFGGEGWTTLGTYGIGINQFITPTALAYDSTTDYIYVLDCGNHRIVKTQIDGFGWTSYGSFGRGIDQFEYPNDLSYDPTTEFLYIADLKNHRIVKTKMGGTDWETWSLMAPTGVTYDPISTYFFICDGNYEVYLNNLTRSKWNGEELKILKSGVSSGMEGFEFLDKGPFCDSGYLYVCDSHNSRIVKFQERAI
jgi:DNA-binding beta-propeller fold protein YncE